MSLEDQLFLRLSKEEAMRLTPYLDCCGKPWRDCTCPVKGNITIAAGVNIDAGLSQAEAEWLTRQRIEAAENNAGTFSWYPGLDPVRQEVVSDMLFNLGLPKFSGFQHLIAALAIQDFHAAAEEMRNSHWAQEVGDRAKRLAAMMEKGAET